MTTGDQRHRAPVCSKSTAHTGGVLRGDVDVGAVYTRDNMQSYDESGRLWQRIGGRRSSSAADMGCLFIVSTSLSNEEKKLRRIPLVTASKPGNVQIWDLAS